MTRVVIVDCPPEVIEDRRRKGLDHHDEMWQGEYHMSPAPSFEHQRLIKSLILILAPYCEKHGLGTLEPGLNVRDPRSGKEDFRVPDLVLIPTDSVAKITDGVWVDFAPSAVIEIRSEGDETYEKIPFYARVGVRELLVLDSGTKKIEVFTRVGDKLVPVSPNNDGWHYSEQLQAFCKSQSGVVRIRLAREDVTREV